MSLPDSSPPESSSGSNTPQPAMPTAAELKSALKAFKKRLKLARLDDESRLGHRAMTSGGRSDIAAIVPPSQFPSAVWEELSRQGKIRRAGEGMYELAEK